MTSLTVSIGERQIIMQARVKEFDDVLAVPCEGEECPFEFDVIDAAQGKCLEAEDEFENAQDGFDGLSAFPVIGSCGVGLEFLDHPEPPRRGDGSGFLVGRRFEVTGPFGLSPRDGDDRLDVAVL